MKPWKKGLHMLSDLFRSRRIFEIPIVTGPLTITPEGEKRRICAEQQVRKRRLETLVADATVFRQEHDDHH